MTNPQYDPIDRYGDQLSIETPENVLLDADIAGFGTRCVAAFIDYLILIVAFVLLFLLLGRALPDSLLLSESLIYLLIAVQFLLMAAYHLILEIAWNGQTIGKRIVGVRIVQSNGLPLTVSGAIIRNLVRLFDYLPVAYAIGMIAMFFSQHTQRLGDIAARTIVIRERRELTVAALKEDYAVRYAHISRTDSIPAYIDLTPLTRDDRRTIVDFLKRRDTLTDPIILGRVLADRYAEKMQVENAHRSYSAHQPIIFLEYIARAFEVRENTDEP